MKTQVKTSRNYLSGELRIGKNAVKLLATDGDVYEFSKSEIDFPLPTDGKILKNVRASLSADGNTFYGFSPATGMHLVEFVEFAHARDAEPRPKMQAGGNRTTRDGRSFYVADKLICTALLRVVSGDFEGCTIPLTLDYAFDRAPDGTAMLTCSSKAMQRWDNFIRLTGGDLSDINISHSSNVLPELEQALGSEIFQVRMTDGFVDEISDLPAGVTTANLKKGAKKTAAKSTPAPAAKTPAKTPARRGPKTITETYGESKPAAPAKGSKKSQDADPSKVKPLTAPKPLGRRASKPTTDEPPF